jgi:hypothetical protein
MNHASCLFNYLPINLQHGHLVGWLEAGPIEYREPFFDETISKMRCLPQNRHPFKSTSSLQMMEEWAAGLDCLKPSAIVFHVSRCGSTLLSQLLGLNSNNIVLAEVPFFDDLLRARFKENGQDQSQFLPHAVSMYGQKRKGNEERLFIKTDSWHLFFNEQWRSFYPDTPFVLLYRRPDEVIRSQMKRKGLHVIPGMIEKEIFELGSLPAMADGYENYIAAVLEQYYTQMLAIANNDPLTHLFDYKEGIGCLANQLLQLTGTWIDGQREEAFEQRLKQDAKDPMKAFNQEPIVLPTTSSQLTKTFERYQSLTAVHKQPSITA